ncbi:MAG: helix-turn-helix domain-containing protein [Ruminiclostridium sp.]|nr:helix-turn-helix domain-containing protein [Ruminiclostridium sp.]
MAKFNVERVQGYTVMSNFHLRDSRLSLKAKGLMSVMLSLPPEWDYSLRGLAAISRESISTISTVVKELEELGYIERYQERESNGKLGGAVYNLYEKPKSGLPCADSPCTEKPNTVNPCPEKPRSENQSQLNKYKLNTKKSNKEASITQSINPAASSESQIDWIDRIEETRALVKDNIEYDVISGQYEKEQLDEIVEIMTEVICTSRDMITVGKQDMPAETVRSRFLKVNSEHIDYIFWCLKRNTTKIRNIKAYLTTVIYNAPATISNFYAAEVNHDLNGSN